MKSQRAAISSDIDSLQSIYRGRGCRRPGGYTFAEVRIGLENFCRFLEPFRINATLFMVGEDFRVPENQPAIRSTVEAGHEIGNHTLTHAQGFRWLTAAEKEAEIGGMEEACREVTGQRPVGFRAPGWNASDDTVRILQRRGYVYDSSIHPTILTPLLKFLHWWKTPDGAKGSRTTLGDVRYMFAPLRPYRTAGDALGRRGCDGIIELPLTVVPFVRVPFWATFLLATGFETFKRSYQVLRARGFSIQYQFHVSDFVDYTTPELTDQVPLATDGVHVPRALRMPLDERLGLFRRVIETISADYEFRTLAEWAEEIGPATAATERHRP